MKLSPELEALAKYIDAAADSESDALLALSRADEMATRSDNPAEQALLAYFHSNAWANLYQLHTANRAGSWSWEQPDLQQQVRLLRIAMESIGFSELDPIRRCQIHTNLGNALNTVGRVPEAIEQWDTAIAIIPRFGMALGNRALGLETYARGDYDPGHRWVFWLNAIDAYDAALVPGVLFESPGRTQMAEFRERAAAVGSVDAVRKRYSPHGHSLGRSETERTYRSWVLKHRLFLNTLNDLGPISLAAHDVLSQPDFVTAIDEPPSLIGFFNQLKQEFVSARWFVYSGMIAERPHFSDRGVLLHDTLDYPAYCLAVEQIKAGYRLAYSLFDKIAFFINHYWRLNVPERDVSFRTIWFVAPKNPAKGLRPDFSDTPNLFMRGLYWISKDLFEPEMRDTTEPAARDLASVRNHLEHKYLKVTDDPYGLGGIGSPYGQDALAHILLRSDLETKAVKMLKLARCGLIHLSLAMHAEERQRHPPGQNFTVPMEMHTVDDRRKR